jgi:hypothetical protein
MNLTIINKKSRNTNKIIDEELTEDIKENE